MNSYGLKPGKGDDDQEGRSIIDALAQGEKEAREEEARESARRK